VIEVVIHPPDELRADPDAGDRLRYLGTGPEPPVELVVAPLDEQA
jgi:hypothetical protein